MQEDGRSRIQRKKEKRIFNSKGKNEEANGRKEGKRENGNEVNRERTK